MIPKSRIGKVHFDGMWSIAIKTDLIAANEHSV